LTGRHRRRHGRGLLAVGLIVALVGTGGALAAVKAHDHRRLAAREHAKASHFSLSKTRDATRAATGGRKPAAATVLRIARPVSTTFYDRRTITFRWDGTTRDYLVFRPRHVTTSSLPILMQLSGSYIDAAGESTRSNYLQVARQAILVYPDATDIGGARHWDAGHCCGAAASGKVDDVGFLREVIRQVRTEPDAAQGPAYLAGYSNGGKMALLMACDDPQDFAAVAVYGAVPSFTCADPRPISMLEMAGTADPDVTVGPGGRQVVQDGFTQPRVTTVLDRQLRLDGCAATQETGHAGTRAEGRWTTCADGRLVGLALPQGQTHTWPEKTAADPSAQQVIWSFFEALGAGR
jgi:polyhydroxybutyrate depolymerase